MSESEFQKQYQNCQPPALVEKTTAGFLLKESSSKMNLVGWVVGILFFSFFLMVQIIFVFSFIHYITMMLVENNMFLAIGFLFVILFLIIYLSLSIIFKYSRYLKLLPEQLILLEYPLKLGGEYSFTFLRQIKNNKIVNQPGKLKCILACVEKVTYTKGTDTETEIHTIYESQVREQSVSQGANALKMKHSFRIPSHLPPSFEGKNNQIRWILSIHQDLPELPKNIYSNFTLVVDPII